MSDKRKPSKEPETETNGELDEPSSAPDGSASAEGLDEPKLAAEQEPDAATDADDEPEHDAGDGAEPEKQAEDADALAAGRALGRARRKKGKKSRRHLSKTGRAGALDAAEAPPGAAVDTTRRNLVLALLTGLVVGGGGGFTAGYFLPRWLRRRQAQRDMGPLPRAYIEIAPFNVRKGPNPAKVTIVEFSDFQ